MNSGYQTRRPSFNPLWKLLIDRGIKKKDLQELSGVSAASIAKMGRGGNVTTDVLVRICDALECDIADIVELTECETDAQTDETVR